MPIIEDEPRPKPQAHSVGEDLSRLSEDELRHRIELLKAEIVRIGAALAAKEASRKAAASFFKS